MNAIQLIRILQFADSVLPVGAFAFSNGVESAIQAGIVRDATRCCRSPAPPCNRRRAATAER